MPRNPFHRPVWRDPRAMALLIKLKSLVRQPCHTPRPQAPGDMLHDVTGRTRPDQMAGRTSVVPSRGRLKRRYERHQEAATTLSRANQPDVGLLRTVPLSQVR